MSVLYSKDNDGLFIDCKCGCSDGVKLKISKDDEFYFLMSYVNGKFVSQQKQSILKVLLEKIKKIWFVIRGKDYCYSEICMSKDEFEEFRKFIINTD